MSWQHCCTCLASMRLHQCSSQNIAASHVPAAHRFTGIRQPARTFLLYGPPGTGKTLLVEKVAAEAGFTLLSISPSMVLSKWAGDSEKAISGVFDMARTLQPCIIFLVSSWS